MLQVFEAPAMERPLFFCFFFFFFRACIGSEFLSLALSNFWPAFVKQNVGGSRVLWLFRVVIPASKGVVEECIGISDGDDLVVIHLYPFVPRAYESNIVSGLGSRTEMDDHAAEVVEWVFVVMCRCSCVRRR